MLRLKFGLDGQYQDDVFLPSPLIEPEQVVEDISVPVIAEPHEEYKPDRD